jgi:hypothetical protein
MKGDVPGTAASGSIENRRNLLDDQPHENKKINEQI